MKWEYTMASVVKARHKSLVEMGGTLQNLLNGMSWDGWELASKIEDEVSIVVILRRPRA